MVEKLLQTMLNTIIGNFDIFPLISTSDIFSINKLIYTGNYRPEWGQTHYRSKQYISFESH